VRDLKGWLDNTEAGPPVHRVLSKEARTYFTAVTLGALSSDLQRFLPWRAKNVAEGSLWQRSDFNECFPIDFEHDTAKVKAAAPNAATPVVRKKVRVLSLPTWAELRLFCLLALTERYRIPSANAEYALLKLLHEYVVCAIAVEPAKKTITGTQIEALLQPFRVDGATWKDAAEWLSQDESSAGRYSAGDRIDWRDFVAKRYVDRAEFKQAEAALKERGSLVLHGHPGSGKTTIARFLAFKLLFEGEIAKGYVLTIKPGFRLAGEREFIEAHASTPVLFVIEDSHFALDECRKLLEAFQAALLGKRALAKIIVTTVERYGPRLLAAREKQADPHSYASALELEPLSAPTLTGFLEEYIVARALHCPLPATVLADLAGGRIALALIILRAALSFTSRGSVLPILNTEALDTLLRNWVLDETGMATRPQAFEELFLPVFSVVAYWLPHHVFAEGGELLERAGLLSGQTEIADFALAYLVARQPKYRAHVADAFVQLMLQDSTLIAPALQRLARVPDGRVVLRDVLDRAMQFIMMALADNARRMMPLADVATVLLAADRVGKAGQLFGDIAAPDGNEDSNFWNDFIALERLPEAGILGDFFDSLFKANRYLVRRLAHRLGDRHAQIIIAALLRSSTLKDIAAALRGIARCSRGFGRQLKSELEQKSNFKRRLKDAEQQPSKLPDLVSYSVTLYSLDRQGIGSMLDRTINAAALATFFLGSGDRTSALVTMTRIAEVRPRVASDALRLVWESHAAALVDHCLAARDFVAFTKPIYFVSRLNRRVAWQLALETFDHASHLVSKIADYEDAATELQMLQRTVKGGYAHSLAVRLDRSAMLSSLRKTSHQFANAGRTLATFATLDPTLAAWLEQELDLPGMVARITRHHLFNLSALLNGFLRAAPSGVRPLRVGLLCQASAVRSEIIEAWRGNRSLTQSVACIALLQDASMTVHEISSILGFANPAQLGDDLTRRLSEETTLRSLSGALYQIALILPGAAEDSLHAYVEKTRMRPAERPQIPGKRFPSAMRNQLGPYKSKLRDLVAVGAMLQIGSGINPIYSLELAQSIDQRDLEAISREETNLGRISVFLSGLAASSRSLAISYIDRLADDGIRSAQLEENENLRNVWHFARTLTRISKRAGSDYIDFVSRNLGNDIVSLAHSEANVMEVANWLRLTTLHGGGAGPGLSSGLLAALDEAREFDSQIRHLLQGALALTECGKSERALQFANAALHERRQLRALVSVQDLMDILLMALEIEAGLNGDGFTADLLGVLEEDQVESMFHRQLCDPSKESLILLAFAAKLICDAPNRALNRFAPVAERVRPQLLSSVSSNRPLEAAIVDLLCGASPERLSVCASNPSWTSLTERGLASLLARTIRGVPEESFTTLHMFEALEPPRWELTSHAPNLQFALAYRCLDSSGAPDIGNGQVKQQAESRCLDEAAAATRWLLSDFRYLPNPYAYVLSILKGTALRRSYLAWESTLVAVASEEVTGTRSRDVDLEALSA